ncbi:MAG TPA: hypothetical protein VG125_00570 [Pirellulales bacterium]|nr:hypothetical protein [Pirellulales bacterium]
MSRRQPDVNEENTRVSVLFKGGPFDGTWTSRQIPKPNARPRHGNWLVGEERNGRCAFYAYEVNRIHPLLAILTYCREVRVRDTPAIRGALDILFS